MTKHYTWPTRHRRLHLTDYGLRFAHGHVGLPGQAKHVRSAWIAAFAGQRHRMLAAGTGRVHEIIGGRQGPFAGRVVQNEGEVLHVVVAVVGQNVEHHATEGPEHVPMIAGQDRCGLQEVAVVGRWDTEVSLDEVAERVDVEPPVAVAVESFDAEEAVTLGRLEDPRRRHVNAGSLRHVGIGVLDRPGVRSICLGGELDDPVLEALGQIILTGADLARRGVEPDQHLRPRAGGRAAGPKQLRQDVDGLAGEDLLRLTGQFMKVEDAIVDVFALARGMVRQRPQPFVLSTVMCVIFIVVSFVVRVCVRLTTWIRACFRRRIKAKRWTSINNSGRPPVAEQSLTSAERVNPAAISVAGVARLLGVPVAALEKGFREGTPAAANVTMNLITNIAWLLRTMANDS